MISPSTPSQTHHLPTGSGSRYVCSVPCPHLLTLVQNALFIQKAVVTLLIPGILPDFVAPPPHRPPQPQPTLTSQSRYRSQTCPTCHSRSLPRHLTMLAQSTLQATNPECAPYSVRSFKDPSLYLLSVGHMIEITILYHPTWQTSSTSQTVGQRHPSPSLNPSCSSHARNNARGYTPLTARWSTVISLLRALLNPTQCLTEDGKELTQVCVIDYESGIVVYDRLVKPPKPVIGCLPK